MCLNLIGSKFNNINEVEFILEYGLHKTEEDILKIKDNREAIEKELKKAQDLEFLRSIGLYKNIIQQ